MAEKGDVAPPGMPPDMAVDYGLIPQDEVTPPDSTTDGTADATTGGGVDTGSPILRLAQNLAISRGITPEASWIDELGGVKQESEIDLSALLDYGWEFDDVGNLVSPDGDVISVSDIMSSGTTYDKDAYADIVKEYFPDVTLAPEGMTDDEANLLGYLSWGELKSFVDDKISEAQTQQEKLQLASSIVFPGLTLNAVLVLAEKRPEVFVQELMSIGRNSDTEALLKSLYPDITDNEMRSIFGDPLIMSEQEFADMLQSMDTGKQIVGSFIGGIIPAAGLVPSTSYQSYGLNLIDVIQFGLNKDKAVVGNEWLQDKYQKYVNYMTSPIMQNSFVRSVNAGIGDIQLQLANGAKWLGADGVGTYFSNLAKVNQSFEVINSYKGFSWEYLFDPDWWATVGTRSLTSQMPLLALSIASGGTAAVAVGGLRMATWAKTAISAVAGSALPTVMESGMEAGMAYDQALTDGLSAVEAKEVADKVFRENMLLLGGSNAVEFALAFTPLKNAAKIADKLGNSGLVKIGKIGGKLTVTGLTEAGQEWYQEIISRQALGQKIEWDDEMKLTVALGGLFGVIFGAGGMTVSAIQSRVYNSLPTNLQNDFDSVKQSAVESGMTETEATNVALNSVAQTKDGAEVIDAVAKQIKAEEYAKVLQSNNPVTQERNNRVIDKLEQDVEATGVDVAPASEPLTPEEFVANELSKPAPNGQAKSLGAMAWGSLFKNKEARTKALRSAIIDHIEKYVPKELRGQFLRAVSNAKSWDDFYAISDRIDTNVEEYNKKLLTSKIKTELNKAKPLIKDKIKQGKYTADVQDKLDDVLKNWNTPRSQALDNIANATERLDNGTIDFIEYTDILDANANIGVAEMNSQELSDTLDYIRELKNLGRSERKARADKLAEERKQRNDKLISVATGGKGITEAEAPTGFVSSLKDLGNKIVNWQVAFTDLMDIISQKEGKEKYQGSFNEFVDNRISKARNSENDGRIKRSEYVLSSFSRIFGTQSDRLRNKLMNEQQRNKIDLGSFRNSEGNLRNLRYTKAELFDLYLSFQDETKIEEFKSNNKFTDEMINAIKSNLTTKEIAWCDFVLEFLDTYYDDINKVYRNKYGINLSKNKNYWMRTRDIDKSDTPEHIMQMKDMANRASTLSSNLKEARRNKTPYKIMSAHDKLINYVSQMEHFMAWTDTIQELRSVFGNRDVRTAIAENYGDDMNRYINRTIDNLARGGIESAKRNRFLDALRGNFSVAVLGLKPMIAIKQPIAILGFMTEMPYGDFVSGVIDFMKNPVENYRILYSKSSGLRSRYQNGEWERDFATKYNKTRTVVGTNMPMSDFFLYLIRLADMAGTVPGQWAKYKSSLKRGMSDENAILSSEQSVNRTQNTSYLETMSAVQTEGSWAKLLTMFQDQTNKYFRLMMAQTRVIFNKAQTPKARVKAFSDLMILWVVLPALFQFMSDGFKWRPDRQGRAIVLGPVNYLLIFGQMAQSVYGWTTGEKYPYEPSPVLQVFEDLQYFISDVREMVEAGQDPYKDITMDDVISMVEDLAKSVGGATGIPTPYLIQIEKAIRNGKLINLLYSDWALEDPEQDDYAKASDFVDSLGQTTLTDEEYAKWQEDILNGIKTDDPPIFTMSNLNSKFNSLFGNMLPSKVMSLAGSNGLLIEWASKETAWADVGILPNVDLTSINTLSSDDTIIQYHKQWLERSKLTKLSDIAAFDKLYPKAYLGNVTEAQYNALLQWINISKLPDTKEGNALKEAFLKAHPEISVNPREQYLIDNPDVNAKLFIFGQANIYSYKAFKEVMKLVEKYNIPLETLDKAKLSKVPTENVSSLLKAYYLLPEGSKRTALRKKYAVLDAYLVKTMSYKPVSNNWLTVTNDKIFALDEYNKKR